MGSAHNAEACSTETTFRTVCLMMKFNRNGLDQGPHQTLEGCFRFRSAIFPNRQEDSAAVAEILKGNPKYIGASLAQGHAHFSPGCGFMVGLGKRKLCTKFEIARFSHCVIIEGKLQMFASFPSPCPRPHPFFCV